MEAFIDWLQFTVFEDYENENIRTYADIIDQYLNLEVNDFQPCNGLYGYKSCQQYQNIRVLYDGPELMGIHVQISGKGCRYLESLKNFDWNRFLGHLVFLGVKFTRIDIAIDQQKYFDCNRIKRYLKTDRVCTRFRKYGETSTSYIGSSELCGKTIYFGSRFDCNRIKRYLKTDRVCTRFRKYGETSTSYIGSSELCGKTIYFGSRKSEIFIRFYDKGLESDGQIEGTRLEIVLRDDKANEFVFQYLNKENFYNLTYLTSKVINYYLRFIKCDATRKERCSIANWWSDFINTVEKLSLGKGNEVVTLDRICRWFEKQVSTSLKLIIETKGIEYVDEMVKKAKLSNRQNEMIKQFKLKGAI